MGTMHRHSPGMTRQIVELSKRTTLSFASGFSIKSKKCVKEEGVAGEKKHRGDDNVLNKQIGHLISNYLSIGSNSLSIGSYLTNHDQIKGWIYIIVIQ
jgi:hypothetical protein